MLHVAPDVVDDLHFAARWLVRQTGSYYGHVALRVPEREEFILRYLRPPLNPSDEELLRFDMKGTCLEGKRESPQEINTYTETFRSDARWNAVIHTHPETRSR